MSTTALQVGPYIDTGGDVAAAAWRSVVVRGSRQVSAQCCARCAGTTGPSSLVRQVVSRTFTAYDDWRYPAGTHLCAPCSWMYRTRSLRQYAHKVSSRPSLTVLTSHALRMLLSRPLLGGFSVVVPLRPGRKHILPHARWGHVAVDDATLPWTASDVAALAAVIRLRRSGFGVRALAESSPPFPPLRDLSPRRWPQIFADWESLDPYRRIAPWWGLALRASIVSRGSSK